jgi:hypothetical protein
MLVPQPESDLSLGLIVVGADIIKILKETHGQPMVIDDVLRKFIKFDSRRNFNLFLDALTFLYTIGAIKEENYKVSLKYGGYTQKTLF